MVNPKDKYKCHRPKGKCVMCHNCLHTYEEVWAWEEQWKKEKEHKEWAKRMR